MPGIITLSYGIKERLWDFNFILKVIAWCINHGCMGTWARGLREKELPAFGDTIYSFFFFVIPGYNIILGTLCFLYVIGEIPKIRVQCVFVIGGASLYMIHAAIGITNSMSNDFPEVMLVMSMLCLLIGLILMFDFLIMADYFNDRPEDNEEVNIHDPEPSTSKGAK